MTASTIVTLAMTFLLFLPAMVLHEVAHGWVAYRLGDPTAKMLGRLSLDPLKHIDLFGTILMPILLLVVSGGTFAFGYAKPVPIDPRNFRDRRTGMLLTGIAGPAANLIMATVGAILFRLASLVPSMPKVVGDLTSIFVYLNLLLMFFNLIPIPPMDGSRVVQRFLTGRAAEFYQGIERYGFIIILGVLYFARPVLNAYFAFTVEPVFRFLTGA